VSPRLGSASPAGRDPKGPGPKGSEGSGVSSRWAYTLAALLGVAGTTHFALPRFYDAIVPHPLPGSPRAWTLVSGAVELACAAAVAIPRTRRLGATAAAVLFVVVFPANVQMAIDWRGRPLPDRLIAYGRLPLQIPLVLWALKVRASTRAGDVRPAGRRSGPGSTPQRP
jgi:uncharacterized membrane protein